MTAKDPRLDIEVLVRDSGTAVLTVGGELDVDTATSLHHHMANQFLHGRRHVVLDLSRLDFMDSSGLNVLIKAGREARATSAHLHLAAPTPAVRSLFEITGLTLNTPIHDDVEEALKSAHANREDTPVPD
ncbi:STAS domain-containing protein [Streptomyces sp. NPDC012888]|uniref:STAS domain-containing protein n=1 Tax=Streptomyces sp. NPDC012888 TaxID=3364855 RepID=UPI0036B22C6E